MKLFALVLGLLLALAVACGGDDDDTSSDGSTTGGGGAAATEATGSGDASPTEAPAASGGGGSGGGAGSITIGDEVIPVASSRCFLQEQDVAGSPGKILFTAQGSGMLADGTEFILDVSRYDEDSLFTGDEVEVDIGDPFGDDFYYWFAGGDIGMISLDGSTLRADGLMWRHSEDGSEMSGSFELNC